MIAAMSAPLTMDLIRISWLPFQNIWVFNLWTKDKNRNTKEFCLKVAFSLCGVLAGQNQVYIDSLSRNRVNVRHSQELSFGIRLTWVWNLSSTNPLLCEFLPSFTWVSVLSSLVKIRIIKISNLTFVGNVLRFSSVCSGLLFKHLFFGHFKVLWNYEQ